MGKKREKLGYSLLSLVLLIILIFGTIFLVRNRYSEYYKKSTQEEVEELDYELKTFNGISPNVKNHTLYKITNLTYKPSPFPVPLIQGISLPSQYDLRETGYLVPIMNQQSCGGCWAFATVGSLADRISINTKGKIKVVLSPQYLLSCDQKELGCEGASSLVDVYNAMLSKSRLGGTFLFRDYPFNPQQKETDKGDPCKRSYVEDLKKSKTIFSFQAVRTLSSGSMDDNIQRIKEGIFQRGPITAGIKVYDNIYNYKAGDVLEYEGGSLIGGHAIEVVGWGKDNTGEYWIIKNSWGPDWGDKGYFKQRMGVPEFGLENDAHGGIPDTSTLPSDPEDIQALFKLSPVVYGSF